jgi:hypothetical protein
VDGAALLATSMENEEPRRLRGAYYQAAASAVAGGRVTTLRSTVTVPAATAARKGGAQVRAVLRLLYQPPAFRIATPGPFRDLLVLEVGLVDAGAGLQAFRQVDHCDDPTCATRTAAGVALVDPPGFVPIAGGLGVGAPAAYDTTYTVTISLDEPTGLLGWTIAGGGFGAGVSGTADPGAYLASTAGWAGVPLGGAGFFAAQLAARTFDTSAEGGGAGTIVARFDDVHVGVNGGAAVLFDDFGGIPPNSGSGRLSLGRWSNVGATSVAPAGGALELHLEAAGDGPASFGHGLRVADPAGLNTIQADVRVVPGTGNALLQGRFYNDGSPGSAPSSAVGDVLASVLLNATTNEIQYLVGRCQTPTCSGAISPVVNGVFPGLSAGTAVHTLRVTWDPATQAFTLRADDRAVTVAASQIAPVAGPANAPIKWILGSVFLPPAAGAEASFTARANNVFTSSAPVP